MHVYVQLVILAASTISLISLWSPRSQIMNWTTIYFNAVLSCDKEITCANKA